MELVTDGLQKDFGEHRVVDPPLWMTFDAADQAEAFVQLIEGKPGGTARPAAIFIATFA
jgi:hypothetical protein